MDTFGLVVTTAPASEPVTVSEAKARLRITITAEDADLAALIIQARELCEAGCQRAFVTQTLTLTLNDFPRRKDKAIYLPRPPLQSVAWVKYYDASGVQQTVSASDYWVATSGEPGRVVPKLGYWPSVESGRPDAVEVRFVAGYGLAAVVPAPAKAAILLTLAALRENPAGAVVPVAARLCLDCLETGTVR